MKDIQMAELIANKVSVAGGQTYYVGGYVRDKLIGIPNKDIDIEIHGIPIAVTEEILSSVGKCIKHGVSFGVYNIKGYDMDISLPRTERSNGSGHKDFSVNIDPYIGTKGAAKRRDITINAIMQNVLTHEYLDPYHGIEDINRKCLRHVDAESFIEDPLRVLRVAGFAARLNFTIDPETIALCRSINLSSLSKERIYGEIEKVFRKAIKPSVFFQYLREMEQLSIWFPKLEKTIGCPQNPEYHAEGDVWTHTMMVVDEAKQYADKTSYPIAFMFSALCHDLGKAVDGITTNKNNKIQSIGHDKAGVAPTQDFLQRITAEKKLLQYVTNMVKMHMYPNQLFSCLAKDSKVAEMFSCSVAPYDLLLLAKADHIGRKDPPDYTENEIWINKKYLYYLNAIKQPVITGSDLIALGLSPSPAFSFMIDRAKKLRLSGKNKEEQLTIVLADAKSKGFISDIPLRYRNDITGNDLIKLGMKPSPKFKEILQKLNEQMKTGMSKEDVLQAFVGK